MSYSSDMAMSPEVGPMDPGAIMDHIDHPDHNLPEPGLQPRAQHGTQMAGDVLPMPSERSMGGGMTDTAVQHFLKGDKYSNVRSIRSSPSASPGFAKDVYNRMKNRLSDESDYNY